MKKIASIAFMGLVLGLVGSSVHAALPAQGTVTIKFTPTSSGSELSHTAVNTTI